MNLRTKRGIQPQWWHKSILGCVLCLLLAYLLVALFAWFGPGGIDAPMKVQFNMWLITPIWLTLFSSCFLFSTWQRLLLVLGGINASLFGLFLLLKALM